MRAELKRLQGDLGTTTIYVTHDQIEAMTLAHRVAVMNKGVVQQIATPREIYDNPANLFVAGFIGSPPMNTLPGSIADGAIVLEGGRIPIDGFAPRAAAVFGFRPEDAHVTSPGDADLRATIYASELTGNETVVTCQVDGEQVVVKTDKSFDLPPDTPIGLSIDRAKLRVFDAETGDRIAPARRPCFSAAPAVAPGRSGSGRGARRRRRNRAAPRARCGRPRAGR